LGVHGAWPTAEGGPRHPQQLLTTAHHPWRHQEGAKECELSGTEFNGLFAQGDLAKQEVDLKRPHLHPFLKAAAFAFEQGSAPCGEFLKAEGLTKHVVGSVIEQAHHRLCSVPGRENDHRAAQLLAEPERRTLLEQLCAD
jgi:hypothetical protein